MNRRDTVESLAKRARGARALEARSPQQGAIPVLLSLGLILSACSGKDKPSAQNYVTLSENGSSRSGLIIGPGGEEIRVEPHGFVSDDPLAEREPTKKNIIQLWASDMPPVYVFEIQRGQTLSDLELAIRRAYDKLGPEHTGLVLPEGTELSYSDIEFMLESLAHYYSEYILRDGRTYEISVSREILVEGSHILVPLFLLEAYPEEFANPTPTPEPWAYKSYTVQPGDTLNEILKEVFGYNPYNGYDRVRIDGQVVTDPGEIYPGQVITIVSGSNR